MTVSKLKKHLPNVMNVLGDTWLDKQNGWIRKFISSRIKWYEQTEADLALLRIRIDLKRLIFCYRTLLRDRPNIQKGMYEIHGAALLSAIADQVDLHVPRGDGSHRNFDVRVEIAGCAVNADSKTRKDEFPFNLPKKTGSSKVATHTGVRATIDPHDATDLGLGVKQPEDLHYIDTPESTVIRQLLVDGLAQLPQSGCNLIIFGHIEGQRLSLEDALFGAEFLGIRKNLETRKVITEWVRSPTGAFGRGPEGDPFRTLSGVLWVRLFKSFDSDLFRAYKFYVNPHAVVCVPDNVKTAIEKIAKEWELQPESETQQ